MACQNVFAGLGCRLRNVGEDIVDMKACAGREFNCCAFLGLRVGACASWRRCSSASVRRAFLTSSLLHTSHHASAYITVKMLMNAKNEKPIGGKYKKQEPAEGWTSPQILQRPGRGGTDRRHEGLLRPPPSLRASAAGASTGADRSGAISVAMAAAAAPSPSPPSPSPPPPPPWPAASHRCFLGFSAFGRDPSCARSRRSYCSSSLSTCPLNFPSAR